MDIKAFIEIPQGSSVKYEVDEEAHELKVDRFLHGAMYFPFNYGYIQNTLGQDGDPLDIVILSSQTVVPGVVMKCHSIGLLEMEDEGGIDTKIIAVPDQKIDPWLGKITDIGELEEITKEKVRNFFEHYKDLEKGKWVKLKDWRPAAEAEKEIQTAQAKAAK